MDGDEELLDRIMRQFEADLLKLLSDPNQQPLTYEDTLKPPPQWWTDAVKQASDEAYAAIDQLSPRPLSVRSALGLLPLE
jgi:hypothetical protein